LGSGDLSVVGSKESGDLLSGSGLLELDELSKHKL